MLVALHLCKEHSAASKLVYNSEPGLGTVAAAQAPLDGVEQGGAAVPLGSALRGCAVKLSCSATPVHRRACSHSTPQGKRSAAAATPPVRGAQGSSATAAAQRRSWAWTPHLNLTLVYCGFYAKPPAKHAGEQRDGGRQAPQLGGRFAGLGLDAKPKPNC